MTQFLSAVLWNTLLASLLTLAVSGLGRASWFRCRPAVMHVLWLLVLAKFVVPALIPVPILPAPINTTSDAIQESVADETTVRRDDAGGPTKPTETGLAELVPRPQAVMGIDLWLQFLVAFSGLVSTILILRSTIHGIRFHAWLKSVSQSDTRLERLFERGREQMGSFRSPEVRSLPARCAPFLWAGGRRACIFIPQKVSDTLDDEQLTGVLCHELAHWLRRDAWFSLFGSLVAAVCWWNPLVWWARRQLRWTQELCCDAYVLEHGAQSRRGYAETLLTTLDLVTHGVQLPSALASSWDDSESLKRRFQMMSETSVITRLSTRFGVIAVLLAGGLLCLPVHAQVDSKSKPPSIDAPPADDPDATPSLNQPLVEQSETTSAAPADSAVRIVGRITDPAGKPLAGLQIVAAMLPPPPKRLPKPGRRMEWKPEGEAPSSTTSDDEGRFTIDKVDARSTIMLQFHGAELQQPRVWKPKGALATTISLKVAEEQSDLEVGYVPRNITAKDSVIDGQTIRDVAITWAPTQIRALWGYAPTIEKWKESRSLAQARDPQWKDGLLATDEIVWTVPPGSYAYDEHNQHVDFGPALQLGTSWGQGLRAGSEQEIILFFGALDPRTPAKQ